MRCERIFVAILVLGYCLGVHENSQAQDRSDIRVADLVEAGKLRAGVGVVAPHWAVKDQTSGELRGVAVEVARALAGGIRVPLLLIEYPSPPKVLDGVKDNAWDVGFLAIDPSRATVVDFSPPYLEIDATFLLPESSGIRTVADADQPGVRIAVTGRPFLDGIEWTIIPNRSTALLAFAAGKVDMTFPYEVTIPLLKDIKSQAPEAICELRPRGIASTLIVNREAPPFDNLDL